MLSRRDFLAISALALPVFLPAQTKRTDTLSAAIAELGRKNGGRLGVAVLDTATVERTGHRENERFPMCSTFKFLLAAAVLQRVDRHQEKLERTIAVPPKPLQPNSPLTGPHAGSMISVAALCEAVLTVSDNTGANLLLETIGGSAGITSFAQSIGDNVTRLDRTETSLNQALPGEPRDTTSPAAMAEDLNRILLGDVLSAGSREQLVKWMQANQTGRDKLRAAIPAG